METHHGRENGTRKGKLSFPHLKVECSVPLGSSRLGHPAAEFSAVKQNTFQGAKVFGLGKRLFFTSGASSERVFG